MATPTDILLVDDEPRNLDALEAILADPVYRLLRAEDADRALRLLLDHDVAAIVLDIKMPGVSGLELAQMIKGTKKFRETPIVFLTAYMVDDQHVIAGYGVGAVDYLTKPVNPQILRHKVAVFADLFRKTRQLADLNNKLEERVRERTSELERSEAALRAAAGQKDEFLAVLAHELRNPLAPLRTGLDLLLMRQEGGSAGSASPRVLAAMDRQLNHMVRLIDDLLDISRISRGVLELKKERVNLETIVQSTLEGLRPTFERRSQRLSLDVQGTIEAHVDPIRVAQILTNLLNNAAKFTPDGGDVKVEVTRGGETGVIRVVDSGAGIAADQIDRVFGMFARVIHPGVTPEPGLGIGLALARRLAELHGGTLTASSSGEGQGATFTLSLPALSGASAQQAVVTGAAADVAKGQLPPLKIVVIEDNEDIAETLMEWLEAMGHRVWVARTGQSGIKLVQEAVPRIVFCDIGLPGMDGLDVCRSIRALPVHTQPFMVALTGWGREDDRNKTNAAGFDHHLVKPVGAQNLYAVLRRASE